ncbi:MAG: prolipoprotein diacylglyceryl transferase [Alphaproteobacteria bacterium]|nr:prolipoprotein diacylglyceryl transferase [Alphaproteobacteria bacterium]
MILIEPISPVAFSIAGFAVRWYALAYVAAFIAGGWLFKRLAGAAFSKKSFDDLFTALVLGVIIGGRLGYVLFYNLPFFMKYPLEVFAIWNGGMSFHGGLLGVIVAVFLFAWRNKKQQRSTTFQNAFSILDMLAVVAPIGLFFGRIANFINMEVMGRETARPWGIVFAGADDMTPRHPSPLYEAALEGLALFVIMLCLWRWTKLKEKPGALGGIFGMLYAIFRIFAEQFRAPDAQIGFLTSWGLTMGQLLSAVMFIAGAAVFAVAMRKK